LSAAALAARSGWSRHAGVLGRFTSPENALNRRPARSTQELSVASTGRGGSYASAGRLGSDSDDTKRSVIGRITTAACWAMRQVGWLASSLATLDFAPEDQDTQRIRRYQRIGLFLRGRSGSARSQQTPTFPCRNVSRHMDSPSWSKHQRIDVTSCWRQLQPQTTDDKSEEWRCEITPTDRNRRRIAPSEPLPFCGTSKRSRAENQQATLRG